MSSELGAFCESAAGAFVESALSARGCIGDDDGGGDPNIGDIYWCADQVSVYQVLDRVSLATIREIPWRNSGRWINGIGGGGERFYIVESEDPFNTTEQYFNLYIYDRGGSLQRTIDLRNSYPEIFGTWRHKYGVGGTERYCYVGGRDSQSTLGVAARIEFSDNGDLIIDAIPLGLKVDGAGGDDTYLIWSNIFNSHFSVRAWPDGQDYEFTPSFAPFGAEPVEGAAWRGAGGKQHEALLATAQDGEPNRYFRVTVNIPDRIPETDGLIRAWRTMPTNPDPLDNYAGAGGTPILQGIEGRLRMPRTITTLTAIELEVNFRTGARQYGIRTSDLRIRLEPSWQRYPATADESYGVELALVVSDAAAAFFAEQGIPLLRGADAIDSRANALFRTEQPYISSSELFRAASAANPPASADLEQLARIGFPGVGIRRYVPQAAAEVARRWNISER